MNELCLRCKSYKVDKGLYRIKNCPTENSFVVFCENHKIEAVIVGCKRFEDKGVIEKAKVIPGHEFENDVMKEEKKETLIYHPSKEEKRESMKQAEEQQEVKEKGGNDADHRTE